MTSTTVAPRVAVRGVTQAFGERVVLAGLDLEVAPGELVVLLGRSGSGKSTLLRLIAGLDEPRDGEVRADGSTAFAFQEARLLPWRRVRANVLLGLRGGSASSRRALADAALDEVRLSHRSEAWPATLSGGEAQRASLARALVREPQVLLLDEPFGALDALTRLTMQELVLDLWQRHGLSIVMVTHDVGEAVRLADRILVLEDGRLAHERIVDVPRPRHASDARLIDVERDLLARLGVEH